MVAFHSRAATLSVAEWLMLVSGQVKVTHSAPCEQSCETTPTQVGKAVLFVEVKGSNVFTQHHNNIIR